MRLRHKPWAKEKIAKHPEIVVSDPASYRGRWREMFGGKDLLMVEIGTGKGRFITESAKRNERAAFVGIEKAESVLVNALQRVLNESLAGGVRLICGNAEKLDEYFAPGEVDRIYLNFSDPWPKNRHEKRRLTYKSFLQLYEKVLKKDGEIHLKTDNEPFFVYSLHRFSEFGLLLKNISLNLHEEPETENIMTEYEEKFAEKGNRIFRCEAAFPRRTVTI